MFYAIFFFNNILHVQQFCVFILFLLNLFFYFLTVVEENCDLLVFMFSFLHNFIFNFIFPCYVKEKKKLVLKEKKCGQKIFLGYKKTPRIWRNVWWPKKAKI